MHAPAESATPVIRRAVVVIATVLTSIFSVALLATPASAASSSTGSGTSKSGQGAKAFETCLAQHGVKFSGVHRPGGSGSFPGAHPGGSGSFPGGAGGGGSFPGGRPGGAGAAGGGKTNSKSAKAFAACRSKLPAGGFAGGGTFKPTAAQQQALTAFEQCMSTHGVKIASTATFQTIRSLEQADPAAAKACQSDLQGAFGPRGGAPGASSPPPTAPS
jgi:hypothetical protein